MSETKNDAQPVAHRSPLASAEAVFGIGLIAGIGLELFWPLSYLGLSKSRVALVVLGIAFTVAGTVLIWVTRRYFSEHGQPRAPGKPTTQLLTGGPLAYSRNPLYLGTVLITAGISFLTNAPWILVALVLAVFLANLVLIGPEERYLESQFGDAWRTYAGSVRRWL